MNTLPTTSLAEPHGNDPVSKGTFAYMRTRNRRRLYTLVILEFKKSGLSQADLARRLGKTPDVVCRWLREPQNWTVDTASDLLFAISGAEADYEVRYPLREAPRNDTRPHWLIKTDDKKKGVVPKVETKTNSRAVARFEVAL